MHSLNQRAVCSQTLCLVISWQDLSEGYRVDITITGWANMHLSGTGDALMLGDTPLQGAWGSGQGHLHNLPLQVRKDGVM